MSFAGCRTSSSLTALRGLRAARLLSVLCLRQLPELGVEIGSATEAEGTYTVTRMQIYANGAEYMCVDRLSQILRVNGKDYMSQINNLL